MNIGYDRTEDIEELVREYSPEELAEMLIDAWIRGNEPLSREDYFDEQ